MAWNPMEQSGMTGSSVMPHYGNIYQYGAQMPAGPYSFLPNGHGGTGATPGGTGAGTSSTTSHAGPSGEANDFYHSVLSGQQAPYTQATQDSMLSDASDMTAAAETSQRQTMVNQAAAGGASAHDPSLQGSENEAAAARQAGNMKAKQGIDSEASQANFSAKSNAASHLMDYDLQQQGFQNGMQKTALGFLPYNRGGGSSGGNATGSNQGFLGFQGANMGTFRQPAQPNQYGQYKPDSYYEDMGL